MMQNTTLRFSEYVAISAGMAIASSSFLIISELYRTTHPATVPAAIVLSMVIGVFACLAVGRLARVYPSSPGIRTYLKAVYGNGFSLFMTYFMILGISLFAGVESRIIGELMHRYYGLPETLVTLLIIPAVCLVNLAGYEMPRKLQLALTAVMILFVGGYSVWAAATAGAPPPASEPPAGPLEGLLPGMGIAVFLFMGFEWVTSTGRNVQDYRRLIPVSMVVAVVMVTGFYLTLASALHARLPVEQFATASSPHVVLATEIHGQWGITAMVAMSLLAMTSTLNAGLIGVSRLIYSLGRQKVLPPAFARISASGIPVGGIIGMSSIAYLGLLAEMALDLFDIGLFVAAFGYCVLYACYLFAAGRIGRVVKEAGSADHGWLATRTGARVLAVPAVFFLLVGFSIFFADEALIVKSITTTAVIAVLAALGTFYSVRRAAAADAIPAGAAVARSDGR